MLGVRLRKAFWIGLVCAVVLIPYLAGNYLTYHHLMPISGALKISFPAVGYYASDFVLSPHTRALLLLSVILSAACLLWELGPGLTAAPGRCVGRPARWPWVSCCTPGGRCCS